MVHISARGNVSHNDISHVINNKFVAWLNNIVFMKFFREKFKFIDKFFISYTTRVITKIEITSYDIVN
jgi:hypothetical protein